MTYEEMAKQILQWKPARRKMEVVVADVTVGDLFRAVLDDKAKHPTLVFDVEDQVEKEA